MKVLILALVSAFAAIAQATFTGGAPATGPTPSKLVINVAPGTPQAVTGTIVGDTFPAKNIIIGPLTVGGVTIPQFTVPATATLPWALTFQVNTGPVAATVMLVITGGAGGAPLTMQATVNATPAVGGPF